MGNGIGQLSQQHQSAKAYPEHDCFAWQSKHYNLTPNYTSATCGVCGKILGFKWRSKWQRVRSLFTDEPINKGTFHHQYL